MRVTKVPSDLYMRITETPSDVITPVAVSRPVILILPRPVR